MPFPIMGALAAAGLLANVVSNAYASSAQDKHARKVSEYDKQQSRKAAIERAMTGKRSSGPFGISRIDPPRPPSMAGYNTVAGLGDLVASLAGRKIGVGGGAAPYSDIPGIGVV